MSYPKVCGGVPLHSADHHQAAISQMDFGRTKHIALIRNTYVGKDTAWVPEPCRAAAGRTIGVLPKEDFTILQEHRVDSHDLDIEGCAPFSLRARAGGGGDALCECSL